MFRRDAFKSIFGFFLAPLALSEDKKVQNSRKPFMLISSGRVSLSIDEDTPRINIDNMNIVNSVIEIHISKSMAHTYFLTGTKHLFNSTFSDNIINFDTMNKTEIFDVLNRPIASNPMLILNNSVIRNCTVFVRTI